MTDAVPLAPDAAAEAIARDIVWLEEIVRLRLAAYSARAFEAEILEDCVAPALDRGTPWGEAVKALEPAERLILILALTPHLRPSALDSLLLTNDTLQARFTEFGGVPGQGSFRPTVETALFLLAGAHLPRRLGFERLLTPGSTLMSSGLVSLVAEYADTPLAGRRLTISPERVRGLVGGPASEPHFGPEFPASRLDTAFGWDELILDPVTRREVDDIVGWVRHRRRLLVDWNLERRLKPGFRALFHGPPGTGKSLTAALLGQRTNLPVYRVDLSRVVSKYIGETEKNLAGLFDRAQKQDWILFFDEADSLFGKRTESQNSNDRHANQQISYLLQRIEDFPGVVILATNQKTHLDEAFARRFQAIILFPMPAYRERLRLWRDNFENKPFDLAADVDLESIAKEFELSGGGIINVLRHACLRAADREPPAVTAADIRHGVRRELHKEGRFSGGALRD